MDDEYVRNGVASIFIDVEPLAGRRQVKITDHRSKTDWAQFIRIQEHSYGSQGIALKALFNVL
jgi:hypothetical protein